MKALMDGGGKEKKQRTFRDNNARQNRRHDEGQCGRFARYGPLVEERPRNCLALCTHTHIYIYNKKRKKKLPLYTNGLVSNKKNCSANNNKKFGQITNLFFINKFNKQIYNSSLFKQMQNKY